MKNGIHLKKIQLVILFFIKIVMVNAQENVSEKKVLNEKNISVYTTAIVENSKVTLEIEPHAIQSILY